MIPYNPAASASNPRIFIISVCLRIFYFQRYMSSSKSNTFFHENFINLCTANWCLHVYVFSLIPLFFKHAAAIESAPSIVGWAMLLFSLGMLIPGPCGAHLMEKYSRKQVFLNAMVSISIIPTLIFIYLPNAAGLLLGQAIQGMAFGIAQTALGTTMVNDILQSKTRDRGDVIYAWVGRLGIPIGIFFGYVLTHILPITESFWWSLIPCALAYLLVARTQVPIKAPVNTPLITCDRFILPHSLPLTLSMLAGPWMLGRIVGNFKSEAFFFPLIFGTVFALLIQYAMQKKNYRNFMVSFSYTLLIGAIALGAYSKGEYSRHIEFLIGAGVALVSAQHLKDWLSTASHCQRGTAQNTYMISWRIAFSLGFAVSVCFTSVNIGYDLLLCGISLSTYIFWVVPHYVKSI